MLIQVDDSKLKKKDRTANEPVQFLVGRDKLRYEIVVNFVDKDRIRGYLSTPKDKALAAERPQARPAASIPALGDEFVGPFSSWINVKTAYGAIGNGVADDTASIQHGLDELGKPGLSPVLFLPSGTYRITASLLLATKINVSIVGEDPATTTIIWDGDPGGTMVWLNGVAYSRFVRLTLDGQRHASVAVEQSWDRTHPYFDTGNEYSDDTFLDVEYGIHGG